MVLDDTGVDSMTSGNLACSSSHPDLLILYAFEKSNNFLFLRKPHHFKRLGSHGHSSYILLFIQEALVFSQAMPFQMRKWNSS